MSAEVRAALQGLPRVGENPSGPLGPGLLASGDLGAIIRDLQDGPYPVRLGGLAGACGPAVWDTCDAARRRNRLVDHSAESCAPNSLESK
jgi:hypothetical protein